MNGTGTPKKKFEILLGLLGGFVGSAILFALTFALGYGMCMGPWSPNSCKYSKSKITEEITSRFSNMSMASKQELVDNNIFVNEFGKRNESVNADFSGYTLINLIDLLYNDGESNCKTELLAMERKMINEHGSLQHYTNSANLVRSVRADLNCSDKASEDYRRYCQFFPDKTINKELDKFKNSYYKKYQNCIIKKN